MDSSKKKLKLDMSIQEILRVKGLLYHNKSSQTDRQTDGQLTLLFLTLKQDPLKRKYVFFS
jgi:hypothetical protein